MSLTAQVYAEPLNGQSSHPGRRCRREQHDATFGVTANMTPSANGNAGLTAISRPIQPSNHVGID